MSFKVACFCLIGFLAFSSISVAQFDYDFFWSDRNLFEGAVNQNLVIDVAVGDLVPLYLYWTTNGPRDTGLHALCGVEVSTTQKGIIRFESAESFDFDLLVGGTPSGLTRLGNGGIFGSFEVTHDWIDVIMAYANGSGINEGNTGNGVFLDAGYDADADAFMFGDLTFTALTAGSVQLVTIEDDFITCHNGDFINPVISLVTVNVSQAFIPGDINMDKVVNLLDVQPFVDVLISMEYLPQADLNSDGILDLRDVDPFIELLTGS